MKKGLFGYNRKEADAYFKFLMDSNNQIQSELDAQKEEFEKAKEESKIAYEAKSQMEMELTAARLEIEELKKQASEAVPVQDNSAVEALKAENIKLLSEIEKLKNTKPAESANVGEICAAAYKDMENKNKQVSEKIKAYAEKMFEKMADYRKETTEIMKSVTELQKTQRDQMISLCESTVKKLSELSENSKKTISEMAEIEKTQDSISGDIDGILSETMGLKEEKAEAPAEDTSNVLFKFSNFS